MIVTLRPGHLHPNTWGCIRLGGDDPLTERPTSVESERPWFAWVQGQCGTARACRCFPLASFPAAAGPLSRRRPLAASGRCFCPMLEGEPSAVDRDWLCGFCLGKKKRPPVSADPSIVRWQNGEPAKTNLLAPQTTGPRGKDLKILRYLEIGAGSASQTSKVLTSRELTHGGKPRGTWLGCRSRRLEADK